MFPVKCCLFCYSLNVLSQLLFNKQYPYEAKIK